MRKLSFKGFTTMELLIAVALIALLTTIILLGLGTIGRRTTIEAVGEDVTASLHDAQNSASAGEEGSKWGVHFEFPPEGTHSHAVFKGESWDAGGSETAAGKKSLPKNFSFGSTGDILINGCPTLESQNYCDVVFDAGGGTINYGTGSGNELLRIFHDGLKLPIIVTEDGLISSGSVISGVPTPPPSPTWVGPTTIYSGNVGAFDAVLNPDTNLPSIVFFETDTKKYRYIKCTTAQCNDAPVDLANLTGSGNNPWVTILYDSGGKVKILYSEHVTQAKLFLLTCDDDTCANFVSSPVLHNRSFHNALALPNDIPKFTLNNNQNPSTWLFGACSDSTCTTAPPLTTLESSPSSGTGVSIAAVESDSYISAYSTGTGATFRYTHCSGASCNTPAALDVISGSDAIGNFETSNTKYGSDYMPLLAWVGTPSSSFLKVLHCKDANCSDLSDGKRTIDSSGYPRWSSMKVGTDDKPRISYIDHSPDTSLKYAACTSITCAGSSTETITSFGGKDTTEAAFTSLMLRAANAPMIVYFDNVANEIRVVYK